MSPLTLGQPADLPLDAESKIERDRSSRAEDRDELVMGVDVGTSLSKVVVLVQGRRVAVTFDAPGGEENPYLLPTAVSIMEDGECRLGLHDGASEQYDDIKKPLIDGKTDESVQLRLIAFMTLLFQRVREQIEGAEGKLLSGRLDWLVNLGVPTESYGGGSSGVRDLVGAYRRSAEAGWSLAQQGEAKGNEVPLTLDHCKRAMQSGPTEESDRIGVFPEFVAQVASYVKSKQRQEGVHVVVDAGGGTLDVTVFQVRSFHVNKYHHYDERVPVWARTVEPLGTRYLVDCISRNSGFNLAFPSSTHLPADAQIAEAIGIPEVKFLDVLKPFRCYVKCAVGETVRRAGKKFNLQWPGRMFLVGGGAFIELYKDVAREFEQKEWEFGVRQVSLPRPGDLVAPEIDDVHWHRLAVAYGLSFDPFEISDIRPPEDIEPVRPTFWKPPDIPPPWARSRS